MGAAQCDIRQIIKPSKNTEVLRYRDGGTFDIIKVILEADAKADWYVLPDGLDCLVGATDYETLRNVWTFLKRNIRYKADKPGKEEVKSPGALMSIGSGDCKSFSIFEACLLRALGFKGIRYRFASYSKNGDFTHVYIVCKLQGRDVVLDAVHTRFDEQVPYTKITDRAAQTHFAGIGRLPVPAVNGTIETVLTAAKWALGFYVAYKIFEK